MNAALTTLVIACLINISLGFFIFLRDRQSRANKFFLLMALSVTSWTIANYAANYSFAQLAYNDIANRFAYFFAYFIGLFGLLFTYYFPLRRKFSHWGKRLLILLSVVFIPLSLTKLVAGQVVQSGGQLHFNAGVLSLVYIAVFLGIIAVACRNLLATVKRGDGMLRLQALYVLIAFGLTGFLGLLFNLIIPVFYENWALTNFGPLATLVLVAVISYSMHEHGLFNIRIFFVRATVYSFTTIVLSMLFVAPVVLLFLYIFNAPMEPLRVFIVVALGTIVATSYHRIQTSFNKLTSRIFFRDSYDPGILLADLNKSLVTTIDVRQLLGQTSRLIERRIQPEYCVFVLQNVESSGLRVVGSDARNSKRSLPLEYLEKLMHETRANTVSTNALGDGETKQLLESSNIAVVARLSTGKSDTDNTLGYMVLGERKSGKSYDLQDLRVIETVASTVVIAVQNALHFEEIQHFNVTLQEKVEEATRELRASNEKLRKLDETKDEFVSMASHQLRTPLTSVKGYLSMVLEGDAGKLNDTQKQMLTQSYASSQRMVYLISDLLNLSRLNTGKFVIEPSPVDLRDVVAAEIDQLRETAKARGIELTYEPPKEYPTLSLDETKLHQVVMNFMDNAIYYTPPGGTIAIILSETPSSIEFKVKDSGIGVPRAVQRHLFTKFYRADNARRMRPDGTGLGLFMAKKVVVAQGGAVIFESEEGKGSTFGFRFNKADHAVHPQDKAKA